MKRWCLALAGCICLAGVLPVRSTPTELNETVALAFDAGVERGFVVRASQAPNTSALANSYLRALQQIHGSLLNNLGEPVPNVALPGTNSDRSFTVDLVNFNLVSEPLGLYVEDDFDFLEVMPATFPGIPGTTGSVSNFVTEVTGFLELTAGTHTLSIITALSRTDANDDDDYRFFVGSRPRDLFAPLVAQFERRTAFSYPTSTENLVSIVAPVAGLYPFRLLHWQTGFGSMLLLYSVDPATRERILLNDPTDPRALRVYSTARNSHIQEACVGEISPSPGSSGVKPGAPVKLVLLEGMPKLLDGAQRLFINDTAAAARTTVRDSNRVTMIYSLPTDPALSNVVLRIEYADASGQHFTNQWSYSISSGTIPRVTGQWDFDQGNLSATIGTDLEYFDGPEGLTAVLTRFGTTEELGLPPIRGESVRVMEVPGDVISSMGYLMRHGIPPNGGGTLVNQYTLLFDIMVSSEGTWAASLLQISSTNNLDDGDLFWQNNLFGQGLDGYLGTGIFTPDAWHRVIAAYDMAASPPVVTKYIDGVFQDDWTSYQGLDHPRRAMQPAAILFADGDHDERRTMWVNSIQIRAGALTKFQMEALGGPSAQGIPLEIPEYNPEGPVELNIEALSRLAGMMVRVTWLASYTNFVLEATSNLSQPDWKPVPGINGNTHEFAPDGIQQYFRLRSQ
jgi:hypothetical protein